LQVQEVADYSIVLCDVNGVGVALSEDTQGAYVIEEIKKIYPEKIVIAYTAGSAMSKMVQRARAKADSYLRKDASIEDWRDLLDQQIARLADPIITWKQLRLRLLGKDIELVDLLELEAIYLKNIKNGPLKAREKLQARLSSTKGGGAWTGELTKFLGSKAFDLALSASIGALGD
jgi:CheY-like chemotaxis protein